MFGCVISVDLTPWKKKKGTWKENGLEDDFPLQFLWFLGSSR